MIFDELLSLHDPLNVAQMNEQFSALAANVFHRKYSKYTIDVVRRSQSTSDISPKSFIDHFMGNISNEAYAKIPQLFILHDRIKLYEFELILAIFKKIGRFIQKLRVNTERIYVNCVEIIKKFVNKYLFASLIQLDLGFIKANGMETITQPFQMLVDFLCHIDVTELGTHSFNELFPNLQRLSLFILPDIHNDCIDCVYPHLQHLSIQGLESSSLATGTLLHWSNHFQTELYQNHQKMFAKYRVNFTCFVWYWWRTSSLWKCEFIWISNCHRLDRQRKSHLANCVKSVWVIRLSDAVRGLNFSRSIRKCNGYTYMALNSV